MLKPVADLPDNHLMDFGFDNIFSELMISSLGAAFFMYGKKAQRTWPLIGGLAMCAYPYFVSNFYALWAVAVGICVALYFLRNQ